MSAHSDAFNGCTPRGQEYLQPLMPRVVAPLDAQIVAPSESGIGFTLRGLDCNLSGLQLFQLQSPGMDVPSESWIGSNHRSREWLIPKRSGMVSPSSDWINCSLIGL